MARALATVATRLGTLAKARAQEVPNDPHAAQAARIMLQMAKQMAKQIELARLYDSMAGEVPISVLSNRFREYP